MHELAITKSIVDLVQREAEKQGFKRALEIRLRLGEYSGIVPEYIKDFFPLVAEGTVSEKAELLFETNPAKFLCLDCGYEGGADRKNACCIKCGSSSLKMTAGREFFVDSLKVE
ncbi:MAG: hydrogenase maturation nickel metallochaperone HypA [Oscillospiraceae bacterium]|nr:hydrogenase maturation nickel metallochaperone HypA [Oscillospiraceae bacterium]